MSCGQISPHHVAHVILSPHIPAVLPVTNMMYALVGQFHRKLDLEVHSIPPNSHPCLQFKPASETFFSSIFSKISFYLSYFVKISWTWVFFCMFVLLKQVAVRIIMVN